MEQVGKTVKDALLGLQNQSQENTTKLIEDKADDDYEREDRLRDIQQQRRYQAKELGGFRALDTYTEARFLETAGNKQALEASKKFDPTKENLYFQGPTGCGKSHLATIAARRFLYKRHVITTTQMDISREIRGCGEAIKENDIIFGYISSDILVIEDLGISKDTEFSVSLLYEIIQGRYMNHLGGLIITSNLGLGQLSEKLGDDRISSRLAQMCTIFNLSSEKDRRLKK